MGTESQLLQDLHAPALYAHLFRSRTNCGCETHYGIDYTMGNRNHSCKLLYLSAVCIQLGQVDPWRIVWRSSLVLSNHRRSQHHHGLDGAAAANTRADQTAKASAPADHTARYLLIGPSVSFHKLPFSLTQ